MIRVINTLVFVIATTFYMNCLAADMVITSDEIQPPEITSGENDVILKQGYPVPLFVYWDEQIQTILSEFEKTNRQSPRIIVVSSLGDTSPALKYSTDLMDNEFPNTELNASATTKFIVILHKFRI